LLEFNTEALHILPGPLHQTAYLGKSRALPAIVALNRHRERMSQVIALQTIELSCQIGPETSKDHNKERSEYVASGNPLTSLLIFIYCGRGPFSTAWRLAWVRWARPRIIWKRDRSPH